MKTTDAFRRIALTAVGSCLLAAAPTAARAALSDGLAAYYPFTANLSNAATAGASGNATSFVGTPAPGSAGGKVGNGLALVKTETDAIQLPFGSGTGTLGVTAANNLGGSFSIAAWFNHAGPTNANAADNRSFVFETADSGQYDVSFGSTATANQYASYVGSGGAVATVTVLPDEWHSIVQTFTVSGANTLLNVYLDGALIGTGQNTTASVDFSSLNVGKARAGTTRYWNGAIDEVALWTRPLSADEAMQVYNLGSSGQTIPVAPVPEPASAGLAVAAAAGLLARRRRQAKGGRP